MDENARSRAALDEYIQRIQPGYIIGIDEVGWGAIAGPVVVGCVVYETSYKNSSLKDSKKYTTEKSRAKAAQIVEASAMYHRLNICHPGELETFGAGPMLQHMFLDSAKEAISRFPDSLIVLDGTNAIKGCHHPQICLPKADSVCTAVSAASIWAKVWRDSYMSVLHNEFLEYEWYANKGYPTPKHVELLKKHGVSVHHRMNVSMVADIKLSHGTYEEYKDREEEAAR